MPLGKKKADKETNKLFAFVKAGDVHGLKATLKKRHVDLNMCVVVCLCWGFNVL